MAEWSRFPIYGVTNARRPLSTLGQSVLSTAHTELTALQAERLS